MALAAALVCGPSLAAAAAGRCGSHPWCDTSLSPDRRAQLLLAELTPDERVSLLGGDDLLGVTGLGHTGTSNGVPRVGLPTIYFSDGPVGPRQGKATAMPAPMGLAATFSPQAARRHGAVVGNEVKFKGNDVVFAPTVNIMRTPLGGRTFEGYGEDPYLTSRTAVGWIRGAQSEGVIANVKHYAANNQEGQVTVPPTAGVGGSRFTVNAVVDERTLREIYLPHFEAAVKQGHVGSVMCAYNRLNGQYSCENEHLLEDILRRDWGFRGFVLSDYGAAHNTVASLENGLDFEPFPAVAYSPTAVNAALLAGSSTQDVVDEHVRRILRTLFAYGALDRDAYRNDDSQIDQAAHAREAQAVEEQAVVLLKNDGVLPLDDKRLSSIAVIGAVADTYKAAGGSSAVTPFSVTTPRQGITDRAGSRIDVRYDPGDDHQAAAAVARDADVALVFVADTQSGGLTDQACLSLDCEGDQDALIDEVAAANPDTVVVLETGGPVLTPWRERVRGIVEAWYPGSAGGTAIARVLFGDVDPGGRLPVTFPQREEDLPTAGDPEAYPGVAETVRYKEGIFVGYRWFDERGIDPAFPFGFGLSYTSFAYSALRVGPHAASVRVENTGARRGSEVAQLYLGFPDGAELPQPPVQLKGFRKLALRPGQARRVRFPLDERSFSSWDPRTGGWRAVPGCYEVGVGSSSRHIRRRGVIARGVGLDRRTAVRGRRLGPAYLARRRARQRRALQQAQLGARGAIDRYCLTAGGPLRIGYATRRLSRGLGRSLRAQVRGRAVLVLTSSARFAVRGVRPGARVRRLRARVSDLTQVRTRADVWYLAPGGRRATAVYRTRRGRIREAGIADRRLTETPATAAHLIRSWRRTNER